MSASDQPATGGISASHALEIRRAIYSHEPLTPADMDLVFRTQRSSAGPDSAEWTELFSEAVTDYVVHQNDPADYIAQAKADWLAAKLTETGGIATAAEFAVLVDVMKSALDVPPSLAAFALGEIETAIVSGRRAAIGGGDHAAGTVTNADVEALRSILYAAKSDSVGHVSREEAEALFDIAHATASGACDPAFGELFARAVGNYLTAICWHEPSREQALHREHWLDAHESLFQFLMHRPAPGQAESVRTLMQSPLDQADADADAENRQDEAARAESAKITDDKADWVIAHLTREGPLTAAETRLLQWLGAEAANMPPKLRTLIDTANTTRSRAA
ncbi:MAG TPA: hypothetical protein VHY79_06170 [Rhizomicrobium sp.]|jgi:hypothetical protein|nr:hypothetical protein [Rhizomicrobium sp.]